VEFVTFATFDYYNGGPISWKGS